MLSCAVLVFYTLLLQLSTCNVKSHIELHFEYTSTAVYLKSGSDCIFGEVYLKYTAVLLAFACTEVYFKYADENKEGSMH